MQTIDKMKSRIQPGIFQDISDCQNIDILTNWLKSAQVEYRRRIENNLDFENYRLISEIYLLQSRLGLAQSLEF